MIRFFNTLTGSLEEFKPLFPGEVKMYTCGPTVYAYAHIGNFRAFVFEDLLRRFLEFKKFKVQHVMNLTDVDDKTIAGARREGKELDDYTALYVRAFREDIDQLNVLRPTLQPRATLEIHGEKGMIDLIRALIRKGMAYESGGSVYYRVAAFPDYGKLSKKKLDQNIRGARVDRDEYDKEEGADFVLWKKSKEGEPSWDSPWGKGRPGWHIECSAMSMKYLGDTFDIHAGGEDLVFPHHENEIAQSEAATGKPFVRYWLHCKFLLVHGEKMSKSGGNFYTLRDLLAQRQDPMALRYALLSVHYRQPLNFTLEGLKEAGEVIKRLDESYSQTLSLFCYQLIGCRRNPAREEKVFDLEEKLSDQIDGMVEALEDDLNISKALAVLFEGIKEINADMARRSINEKNISAALNFFGQIDRLFGFDLTSVKSIPSEVMKAIQERQEIRNNPLFKESKEMQQGSDALRRKVEAMGWLVKDACPGELSTVKKKRRVWD